MNFASFLLSILHVDQGIHGQSIDNETHIMTRMAEVNRAWAKYADEIGLGIMMTNWERKFIESDPAGIDFRQVLNAYRSKESAITLLWALGIIGYMLECWIWFCRSKDKRVSSEANRVKV